MASARIVMRSSRILSRNVRPFSSSTSRFVELNERCNDTAEEYRKIMKSKPLNPHMTNTNSTIANEMPSIGVDSAPPELITSVDPKFTPKDSVPENTERMTGGTQTGSPKEGVNADLDVGEIEGGAFRVEPLRRTGEDANTMRARLLCQCLSSIPRSMLTIHRPKQEKGYTRERSLALDLRRRKSWKDDTSTATAVRSIP